jgi:hypothetical protein
LPFYRRWLQLGLPATQLYLLTLSPSPDISFQADRNVFFNWLTVSPAAYWTLSFLVFAYLNINKSTSQLLLLEALKVEFGAANPGRVKRRIVVFYFSIIIIDDPPKK